MSFYTSLSGLKAAQTDLAVTSNNVANAGTVGFKKSGAEFADVFAASPFQSGSVAGQGTRLQAITQQFGQGGFQASDNALDLAVSGQGFFVTRSAQGSGAVEFTRNGKFSLDAARNVTDSSGNLVQVLPVNENGVVTATGLTSTRNLQVPATSGDARATGNIALSVTFPNNAELPASRPAYSASNPYAFDRFDPESYNHSTTTTIYDASGNALPATVYYTRTAAPSASNPNSTWEARLFVGNTEVTPAGGGATTLTFDATGKLTAPSGAIAFPTSQPAGAASPLSLKLDFGSQTKESAAQFTLAALTQDGAAPGQLDNVSVGKDGLITAAYSNGDTRALGKVALATFANPEGLRQVGDTRWTVTGKSGSATVAEPGSNGLGEVESGQLEQANVDITEELVALIQAQRNFQANAKAIDTANQMTQIAVNLQN